jgi:hypothetical protein
MTELAVARVETVRRLGVTLSEQAAIRYAPRGGVSVTVTAMTVEILLPSGNPRHVTARGVTSDGKPATLEFCDAYPPAFAPVIPDIINAGDAAERAAYDALLTPAQVARECNVPVTRVKSWYRSGTLPTACRTPGRHRRFLPEDVARLRATLAPRSMQREG